MGNKNIFMNEYKISASLGNGTSHFLILASLSGFFGRDPQQRSSAVYQARTTTHLRLHSVLFFLAGACLLDASVKSKILSAKRQLTLTTPVWFQ